MLKPMNLADCNETFQDGRIVWQSAKQLWPKMDLTLKNDTAYAVEIIGRQLARAVADEFFAKHGAKLAEMLAPRAAAKPAITGLDVTAPETRYRGMGFCAE